MDYSPGFLAEPVITAMYARDQKAGTVEASKSWQFMDKFGNMAYRNVTECCKAVHMAGSDNQ